MFSKPRGRVSYPQMEEQILDIWRKEDVFKKSLEIRKGGPEFVFYEGPPTANGLPHVAHVLPRAIKDLIPRYKAMDGYHVDRKAGWDTHGLPVELEVEKELGISGKPQIEEYGVTCFIEKCKSSVFRYLREWETVGTERIGYWLDLEHAYVTYTRGYIESVWWALRQLWDKGLLYRGHKVVPYCPRCGTSLSSHEVAQGYADAEDPSVFVRFPTVSDNDTSLLIWTTTPWTLPSNTAVAVAEKEDYVVAEVDGERFILAGALVDRVLGAEAKVLETMKGRDLVGSEYFPPFPFFDTEANRHEGAFKVYAADFVSLEDGTGIVHMAPAFGEDDMKLGMACGLPLFQPVDSEGRFVDPVKNWQGQFVKEADPSITEDLHERGLLFRSGKVTHTYPFCWRCDTPLLYYARGSWFVRMTEIKDQVIANNKKIHWHPAHIRDGRFGDFLDNMVDWCLSRERYWGTPLPIWECECGRQYCVGSFDELRNMAAEPLGDFEPHKPEIDDIYLICPDCGGRMKRVPEVIDCWFDSGSMPFAQYHYPFENQDLFKSHFPADYICEAIDQTRGWFYSLLAISTAVFGTFPYANCLVTGHGLDENGQKMSKHKGNVIEVGAVTDKYGADTLRWFLYASSPAWYPKRFAMSAFEDIQSRLIDTLWNTYVFFVTYAEIDGYQPKGLPARLDLMDKWILSRLNSLARDVRDGLDNYDITTAARKLQGFVDELSNWYVRRNRRRFWKSQLDYDKEAAYATLYECLVTAAKLMAPFTPFIADALYQGLVRTVDRGAPVSVHLVDYPKANEAMIDGRLEEQMEQVRAFVGLCRAARNDAAIRTRQPLPAAYLWGTGAESTRGLEFIIADEVNVKEVKMGGSAGEFISYKLAPRFDLLGPKYSKNVGRVGQAVWADASREHAEALMAGQSVHYRLDGFEFDLLPSEVEVRKEPRQGFATKEEEGRGAALDLTITPELRREGLAREVVNRIQKMRKDAGFEVEDTIVAHYDGSEEVAAAIEGHADYIKRETLSLQLVRGRAEADLAQDYKVDDMNLHLEVKREGSIKLTR